MKKSFQILAMIFVSTISYGQVIAIKTEKAEYKINETITLVYEINAKVDSTDNLSGSNFKIISGPISSASTSTVDEQTTYFYSLTYEIKAIYPSSIEINPLTFFLGNQEQKSEKTTLKISGNTLSNKEIDEINFNSFKNNSIKANGTLRYVLSDNFGYIEEFNDFQWIYKRRLTKKEISKLRKK